MEQIRLYDVTARDGLQNEKNIVSLNQKLELICALIEAGYQDIEVGSFVKPSWIPQLADSDQVISNLPPAPEGVRYWSLIPNMRGLERALDCGVEHIATFMSASETHNRKNVNRTQQESLSSLKHVIQTAKEEGLTVRSYISTVFGCPYEGELNIALSSKKELEASSETLRKIDMAVQIAVEHISFGADYIALGDTTGMANPHLVKLVVNKMKQANIPLNQIALHMHDTQGTALANALAGYQAGIRIFDGSTAGLGGCPYAPGATGNAASEDLLNMFNAMGIDTEVNFNKACDAGILLKRILNKELPGRYHNLYRSQMTAETPSSGCSTPSKIASSS